MYRYILSTVHSKPSQERQSRSNSQVVAGVSCVRQPARARLDLLQRRYPEELQHLEVRSAVPDVVYGVLALSRAASLPGAVRKDGGEIRLERRLKGIGRA
jgi:hypothetical protein